MLDLACRSFDVSVCQPLVEGGQKQVYVVQNSSGIKKVLKLIDFEGNPDPAAFERARREVELLQTIRHPNVVSVDSDMQLLGSPPAAAYWLEEFLDGVDLRFTGVISQTEELITLGRDVAAGLGAMHNANVVHRDLSPANVQRLSSGKYVVLDPGFAKHTLRSGLTVGGQPGTRGFMTPEHLQTYSGVPTAASDVFGCCALVYYAATGQSPIPYNGDESDYLRRLRSADHIPLEEQRPDLPARLISVVEQGLHQQPARRFRNGQTLAKVLETM